MAFLISSFLSTFLEIDEVYHEPLPDGKLKVVFVTTGMTEKPIELKTKLWALLSTPIQKVEDIKIEVLQSGVLTKRYKVTCILKPIL